MIPNFRAWLKEEKEMIDVDEIHWYRGKFEFIGDGITFQRLANEVELMQSTGLKDKNGKEVFEGDIITNGIETEDIKNHQTLGFYTVLDDREYFLSNGISVEDFEEYADEFSQIAKIIGNIYENPELL